MLPHLIDPDPTPTADWADRRWESWERQLRDRGGRHYADEFAALLRDDIDIHGDCDATVTLGGVRVELAWDLAEALEFAASYHAKATDWTRSPRAFATLAAWALRGWEGDPEQAEKMAGWLWEFGQHPEYWVCEYLVAASAEG